MGVTYLCILPLHDYSEIDAFYDRLLQDEHSLEDCLLKEHTFLLVVQYEDAHILVSYLRLVRLEMCYSCVFLKNYIVYQELAFVNP